MRYAQIRSMDISNGEGVGVALFTQGCPFHCKGCFNQETWDFNGGKLWTHEVEQKFLELVGKPYVQRVSILGGEPLCNENVEAVMALLQTIKQQYPDKRIWVYTGYRWEEMKRVETHFDLSRWAALAMADVVCEGRFELSKQDVNHKAVRWVGSTNQRVIDPRSSFKAGRVILYEGRKHEQRPAEKNGKGDTEDSR